MLRHKTVTAVIQADCERRAECVKGFETCHVVICKNTQVKLDAVFMAAVAAAGLIYRWMPLAGYPQRPRFNYYSVSEEVQLLKTSVTVYYVFIVQMVTSQYFGAVAGLLPEPPQVIEKILQMQSNDGSPSRGRKSSDVRSPIDPLKMLRPHLLAWMKQRG